MKTRKEKTGENAKNEALVPRAEGASDQGASGQGASGQGASDQGVSGNSRERVKARKR